MAQNRKHITHNETMLRNGIAYRLNVKSSGVYSAIAHTAIDQIDICMEQWKRVLVYRFDLHQAYYTGDNKLISRFMKNLKKHLQRAYQMNEIGYLWVREKERAKHQHYHGVLYLDGNKIRHPAKLKRTMETLWKNLRDSNHLPTIKNPYYFVDNEQEKIKAIERISYLAKARGKGYRDQQAKDYGSSRLSKKFRMVNC